MQTSNVLTLLPAVARQWIYVVYGLISLVITATMAAYTALPQYDVPTWLVATLAILGALAAPVGAIAASNTAPAGATTPPAPTVTAAPPIEASPQSAEPAAVTG